MIDARAQEVMQRHMIDARGRREVME